MNTEKQEIMEAKLENKIGIPKGKEYDKLKMRKEKKRKIKKENIPANVI